MGWNDGNPWYQPEDLGLEMIGGIEWQDDAYSFDLTAVWKDGDGKLYWADDSGCSCPSPFEGYTSLGKLTTGTAAELDAHLDGKLSTAREYRQEYGQMTGWKDPAAAVADLKWKVRQ